MMRHHITNLFLNGWGGKKIPTCLWLFKTFNNHKDLKNRNKERKKDRYRRYAEKRQHLKSYSKNSRGSTHKTGAWNKY